MQREPGSPSADEILRALAAAGEGGLAAGAVARLFSYPDDISRRASRCNSILTRMERRGLVRRSAGTEPSVYYKNTPQYRWFATGAGLADLDRREREPAERARKRAERAEREARTQAVLDAAARQYSRSTPASQRGQAIRELRAAGCSLRSIGAVFGISAEMVRLIARDQGRFTRVKSGWEPLPAGRARWFTALVNEARRQFTAGEVTVLELSQAGGFSLSAAYTFLHGSHATSPENLERLAAACGLEIIVRPATDAVPAGREGGEQVSNSIDLSAMFDQVTRFEVIDEDGRVYVRYHLEVQVQLQDDQRTLKVFVQGRNGDRDLGLSPAP